MKKRTRRILIAGLAAVFAVSLGVVVCQQLQYGKNDRAIDDARRLAGVPAEGKSAVRRPQSASEETEEETWRPCGRSTRMWRAGWPSPARTSPIP